MLYIYVFAVCVSAYFNCLFNVMVSQIKGIADLLEGLLPYSQRHFSRVDRLVRSTFLLDYTLTGMSVIEPEADERELKENSSLQSFPKGWEEKLSIENADEEQRQAPAEALKSKAASKKRKSDRSKDRTHKKVKGVACTSIVATS